MDFPSPAQDLLPRWPAIPCCRRQDGAVSCSLNEAVLPAAAKLGPLRDAAVMAQEAITQECKWGTCTETFLMQVVDEFAGAINFLSTAPTRITVYGSARPKPGDPWYESARLVGREVSEAGYAVLTGGGPGLMEAANRGAFERGGHSLGLNIELPHEEGANPYLNASFAFKHFFVRKAMLRWESSAFVVMPGGFGTMDELFEVLTLGQTGKMRETPVVLVGADYWKPLLTFLEESALKERFINPRDVERVQIVESPKSVVPTILGYH